MSIGPSKREDQGLEITKFDRIQNTVKKAAENYFEKPLYYLFYGMLTLTVLGLFLGMKFRPEYYVILLTLTILELFKPLEKKNAEGNRK